MKTPLDFQAWALSGFLLLALAAGGYFYWSQGQELEAAQADLASTTARLAALELTLSEREATLAQVSDDLEVEKGKTDEFARQFEEVSETVGTLEKLSKTDPELLQKYSKVFFLNEHYVPPRLTTIDERYLRDENKAQEIHREVWPRLKRLLEAAEKNKTPLRIISAYRSFGTQAELKTNYRVTYGSGANQFSADQGYSEHQLGTTVDFTTPTLGANYEAFAQTEAYAWLQANAYRYGFVLSYPENNAYYQFEPWHWRFVGLDLARKLDRDGKYFYDLDQREINKYLVSIFD